MRAHTPRWPSFLLDLPSLFSFPSTQRSPPAYRPASSSLASTLTSARYTNTLAHLQYPMLASRRRNALQSPVGSPSPYTKATPVLRFATGRSSSMGYTFSSAEDLLPPRHFLYYSRTATRNVGKTGGKLREPELCPSMGKIARLEFGLKRATDGLMLW